jgi:hypothetical protein
VAHVDKTCLGRFLKSLPVLFVRVRLPIPRQDFEAKEGRTIVSLEQNVLGFLSKNRGMAYTPFEIIQAIWGEGVLAPNDPRLRDVSIALDNLITREKISGKALVLDTTTNVEEYFFIAT